MLARGQSGAEIAATLVLSPETVRTHVRNAMAKLGASTRSQAVVMALRAGELGEAPVPNGDAPSDGPDMNALLEALEGLHDIESAVVYLADEDGLSLRLAANSGDQLEVPPSVALGEGAFGRVALERRAQLISPPLKGSGGRASVIAAPIVGGGRLIGVLGLAARASRPAGRGEILLAGAFATRIGEILAGSGAPDDRLKRAVERFRTSWAATIAA